MSVEREPSPKAELPKQARSHTERPKRPRIEVEPEEPQRTQAQHAPSHTASTSPEGEQPASRSGSFSPAIRRSKAEQASPERGRRSSQLSGKAEQAADGLRRRDKADQASSVPRRRSARAPVPKLPAESTERELSPAQKEFLRSQLSPGRKETTHKRVQHDASHSASTSPEGEQHDAPRSKSPQPTKFEAAMVDWERRRRLEEEVGKAAALAAQRREADTGLRDGEIRSSCGQRASPRKPRRPRDSAP